MAPPPPPPAAAQTSLAAVKQLGRNLLASRAHVNNLPALLSILSSSLPPLPVVSATASSADCLAEALLSLQAFFVPLLRSGQLSPTAGRKAREQLQALNNCEREEESGEERHCQDGGHAEAIYKSWLWDKYNEFVQLLLQFLRQHEVPPSIKAAAVDAVMEFSREEKNGQFSNRIYTKLCSTLARSSRLNDNVLELIVAKYIKFFDVRYYTSINLEKLVALCHERKYKGCEMFSNDDSASGISFQTFMSNIYDILSHLTPPKGESMESWGKHSVNLGKMHDQNGDGQQGRVSQIDSLCEKKKYSQKDIKKMKSILSKAWVSFLRLPLPVVIYKKVLTQLHKTVIPCLTNPILLSDFLTNSYNIGGVVSVMALNGLFLLITQHGLEYPDFYNKLYALLEPSIFVAKYRARFFELLDACLKSSHLPSYLAASFAKKLGRIALLSPPSGALVVIAMVHNLLRRHPSVNTLVHWPDYGDMPSDAHQEKGSGDVNEEEDTEIRKGGLGVDPFIVYEHNTAKSNALESSLWEVETLRHHYCPAVSRFVASLEADLTIRSKTTEVAIKDFSTGSYATIIAEEVGRRMKQVPLSFYKSIPTTLFPENSPGEFQMTGEVDFPGWKFPIGVRKEENRQITEVRNKESFIGKRNGLDSEQNLEEDNVQVPMRKKRTVTSS